MMLDPDNNYSDKDESQKGIMVAIYFDICSTFQVTKKNHLEN